MVKLDCLLCWLYLFAHNFSPFTKFICKWYKNVKYPLPFLFWLIFRTYVIFDTHHRHYNNAFYARVGGISNSELNRLELELLFLLDFSVGVSSSVFESYCLHLEKEMMWNGINQRIDRNMSNSTGEETEISVGDTMQSSSPNAID